MSGGSGSKWLSRFLQDVFTYLGISGVVLQYLVADINSIHMSFRLQVIEGKLIAYIGQGKNTTRFFGNVTWILMQVLLTLYICPLCTCTCTAVYLCWGWSSCCTSMLSHSVRQHLCKPVPFQQWSPGTPRLCCRTVKQLECTNCWGIPCLLFLFDNTRKYVHRGGSKCVMWTKFGRYAR